jgi:polyisoprenoid-binding protein YceI
MLFRAPPPRRGLLPGLAMLLGLAVLAPAPARAEASYAIDQRFGTIGFSVGYLGVFTTTGRFDRFAGTMDVDLAHPEHTRLEVEIDTTSAALPWPEGGALMQSPAYFDAAQHPRAHFRSTMIEVLAADSYRIHGELELRGESRPITLTAQVLDRHRDPALGAEVAEVRVTGIIIRSAFGMVADRPMVSDEVSLNIRLRIRPAPDRG